MAWASVDTHTLVLLFGMMIVAAYLRLSGFFALVTLWTIRRAHGPRGLLAAVIAASGVLSALFVNDVVCLVLAPLVVDMTRRLALPPVPYLVALATAANVGSVATLTGNPQNMLVGSFSGLSYRGFLAREGPVALLGLVCAFVVVWLVYRRDLPAVLGGAEPDERFPVHYPLMLKTVAAVAVMLVAFLAGVPIALVAIAGAAYCLLTRRVKPQKVYGAINWQLLVLFVGLFVLTGGLERTGLVRDLVGWAGVAGLHRPAVLTAATAVLSNLVSNVPAVLLLKPLIPVLGEPDRGWLILAMASTLAGNLTLLGSVANLIVVEAAREARVKIGFLEYCRVGVPLTLVTLLLGWLVLILVPV
jgi:Na+/H+ antiporter NhaD/arsenite permease-like protein